MKGMVTSSTHILLQPLKRMIRGLDTNRALGHQDVIDRQAMLVGLYTNRTLSSGLH